MQRPTKKEGTNQAYIAQQSVKCFEINFAYVAGEKERKKIYIQEKEKSQEKEGSSSLVLTKREELAKNMKVETTWLTESIKRQLSQFFRRAKQRTTK